LNLSASTYGSNGSVSDAELLYINSLSSNAQDQLDGKQATVTEGSLADGVIVSADIKNDTIDSDDYAAGSIDAEHLVADIIDETKIEAAITEKTTCILATHVYGNPCDVEAIEAIAKKHDLKVIYDAAHCFGVKYKGQSLFNYGDVSTCSFHATKLFHTGEGGALFCQDETTRQEMFYRHNFGHNGPEQYHGLGMNAKMSELQAAMGLSVLPYMEKIIAERQRVCEYYNTHLDFTQLSKLKLRAGTDWNYSYYPVFFNSESALLKAKARLEQENINPRRYFYPSLEDLPYINSENCPMAQDLAKRVLCLPLYVDLTTQNLALIVQQINL